MRIELTEQQRRIVQEQGEQPVDVLDPSTHRAYVLLAREHYEQLRSLHQAGSEPGVPSRLGAEVPPGIRKSQETLRRDLPRLLEQPRLRGQWVAYHGAERIGIAPSKVTLLRECLRRGLPDDQFYVGWIDPSELLEVQEIDSPHPEYGEETRREDQLPPS